MKKFYSFFGMCTIFLILIIILSGVLDIIIKAPDVMLDTFNFSRHNNLSFDDSFRGTNPDSKIVFAYFSDFNCAACASQYPTIKRLIANHSEVNFLFKHLVTTDKGYFSAVAFECAKLQDRGYTLADFMFEREKNPSQILDYIDELEIDKEKFLDCLNSSVIRRLVEGDNLHASYLGVTSSPTVFLNGIKIDGVHSYEVYDEFIRTEIENADN